MNEDLVQLDDDEDIPLPPEPHATEAAASGNEDHNAASDLYEPENPTGEQEEDEKENIQKSTKSDNDNVEESNDNLEGSNLDCDLSASATPANKEPDNDEETKAQSTPSPLIKDGRLADRSKGVLELYDDSDWEELDIDRPKEFEKALNEENIEDAPTARKKKKNEGDATPKSSSSESHQDRSYTPCLDEKHIEEDAAAASQNDKSEISGEAKRSNTKASESVEDDEKRLAGMNTELISEDEELTNENESKRRSRSRSRHHNENDNKVSKSKRSAKRGKETSETFKKIGKRRKDRNYRGDKQHHSRRSHSNSARSVTRSCSNRSPDHSRSRSLTRSPRSRRRNTRSKSYSRSRSHSHSPNGGRHRSTFRSRENVRGFGRGRGGVRYSFRNQQFQHRTYQQPHHQSQYQQQYHQHHHQYQNQNQYQTQINSQRPKRRELPRYDVRNVVSASRHHQKDRYGRDATRSARSRSNSCERRQHSRSYSRSSTRSRTRSVSPKRFRSFSISPSPPLGHARHQHDQDVHRRSMSPSRRRFERSASNSQPLQAAHRNSPLHRSNSTMSLRSRSNTPTRMNGNRNLQGAKNSPCYSPRYTPRLSRSLSKSPRKKKKKKSDKKKKGKKRPASSSPMGRQRRISRQRDPFDDADDFLAPQLGKKSKKSSTGLPAMHWSPSPTPSLSAEHLNFIHDSGAGISGEKPASWTPPLGSPQAPVSHYTVNPHLSMTPVMGKKVKPKRDKTKKKKKPLDKQRKDKKRKRHTMTPEPLPSKEVFASGNNILVSVSFNKEATSTLAASAQQQTVVTLPPTRDEFLGGRRISTDRVTSSSGITSKKSKRKRKKLDAKPVAIIDLERSPFQVHQEPADVIVLTDSEDANDNQLVLRRDRRRNSAASATDHSGMMRENGQREKTPSTCMETILEASYDNLPQTTGPKTPPEPHLVKFNLPAKKQHKVRNNPLHDDADDIHSADELDTVCSMRGAIDDEPQQPHASEGLISAQKIGPNTPPESGPCSPDAYDPFEPTKSPSLSPRSPTPTPAQNLEPMTLQASTGGSGTACSGTEKIESCNQKHNSHSEDLVDINIGTPTLSSTSNPTSQANTSVSINPVDLVMALMNKPSNNIQQELTNKTCDVSSASYLNSTTMSTALAASAADDKLTDNTITVLSNVLLTSSTTVSASQHIPVISSPPTTLVRKLGTLPKAGGSVASSNSGIANLPSSSGTIRNGNTGVSGIANVLDDSFNMDIESPYSPGSADYEDLFEPPPEGGNAIGSNRRSKNSVTGKAEMFDNLFGSSSPVGQHRMSSRYNNSGGRKPQRANNKNERKSKIKGGFPLKILFYFSRFSRFTILYAVKDECNLFYFLYNSNNNRGICVMTMACVESIRDLIF